MDYIWTFYINKKSQASINKKLTILNCGPDGTRTRDPMRDRHVF